MKTYPIFLASSFELQPEREKFEIFISRQNKRLVKKNVMLDLEVWEDMGAELNNSRKQDDYNKKLQEAEIVVVLFWTKMGKYTREEFDLAYQRFLDSDNKRPLVYLYEKTAPAPGEPQESKKEFIKRLLTEGKEQFQCTFDHYSVFESHFQQTLSDLFEKNELTFGKMAERHSLKAPFPPSPVIGRDGELETISEKFKNKGQVILLSAEGGMGKTTLASKYWQENKFTYSHCAYLFCEGGIIKAIMDDGLGLDLKGLDDPEKIRQLQRKLSVLADDFLLFLDNANEAEDIMEFFRVFSGYNWNVLITSRCRDVLPNKSDEISLAHLDSEDAKTLFRNFYLEDSEEFEVLLDRLLKGISYHTLLTEVFAKNLKEASEIGTDLKSFLKKLEEKGLILDSEDNFEVNTGWDESVQKHAATVNDILEILYDFSKLSEEERYLLVNLALLPSDSYSIPFLFELFEPVIKRAFRDCLKNLYRKGWVGGGDQQYKLSPVIQQLVHKRNQRTIWEDGNSLIAQLTKLLKEEEKKDNRHTKFKWINIAKNCAMLLEGESNASFGFFQYNLAAILRELGGKSNLILAIALLEKSLEINLRTFNKDSSSVWVVKNELGLTLLDLGGKDNLRKAKTILENVIESIIQIFGMDSNEVSLAQSHLALVLIGLGGIHNLYKARDLLESSLKLEIRTFGENSAGATRARNNLAKVLLIFGGEFRIIEAKELLNKCLETDLKMFGENSPSVALSRSNLAVVFLKLGKRHNLLQAKELLEKSLESNIRNFGEESVVVATVRTNLASVFCDLGGKKNLLQAIAHQKMALTSNIKNYGDDSPMVSMNRNKLAHMQGKHNIDRKSLKSKLTRLFIWFSQFWRNESRSSYKPSQPNSSK